MKLTVIANQDRYTKCSSCRATADYLITNPAVVITKVRPGAEPTSEWVDGEQVFRDEVTTYAATASACKRHAELNATRVAEAKPQTLVFDGERWNEADRV